MDALPPSLHVAPGHCSCRVRYRALECAERATNRVTWDAVRLLRFDGSNGRMMDCVAVTAAVFTTSRGKSGTINPGNCLGCAPVINTGSSAFLLFFLLPLFLCAIALLSSHAGAPNAPPSTGHAPEATHAVPPRHSCRSAAASPPHRTNTLYGMR